VVSKLFNVTLLTCEFRFNLHPDLSLRRISQTLPFTYTGADLYALCSDAMLKAITRSAQKVDDKVKAHNASLPHGSQPITVAHFFDHFAKPEDTAVMVEEQDFEAARRELVPSVSAEELGHYERVRRAFEGTGSEKVIKADVEEHQKHVDARKSKLILPPTSSQANNHQDAAPIKSPPLRSLQGGPRMSPPGLRGKRKGSGKAKTGGESVFYFSSNPDDSTDVHNDATTDEDEYVIRTEHLGTTNGNNSTRKSAENGFVHRMGSAGKGKGKGSTLSDSTFGDAAMGDEDMYA
jgi:peroxin-6